MVSVKDVADHARLKDTAIQGCWGRGEEAAQSPTVPRTAPHRE